MAVSVPSAMATEMNDIITWLAMGFGLGESPVLPGTVGALPGLIVAWLILRRSRGSQLWYTAVLTLIAIPICDVASNTLGGKDDNRIVADEFMLFPIAVVAQTATRQPWVLAGVFLTSRGFDGLKPLPAAQAESYDGGLGIVLDDMVANIYTWILLAVCFRVYRRWRHIKGRHT